MVKIIDRMPTVEEIYELAEGVMCKITFADGREIVGRGVAYNKPGDVDDDSPAELIVDVPHGIGWVLPQPDIARVEVLHVPKKKNR